jgi:hypothetical protein
LKHIQKGKCERIIDVLAESLLKGVHVSVRVVLIREGSIHRNIMIRYGRNI